MTDEELREAGRRLIEAIAPKNPPLPIGTIVKPYGTIEAIGLLGCERYYWMVDKRGDVAMMPASVIETMLAPV